MWLVLAATLAHADEAHADEADEAPCSDCEERPHPRMEVSTEGYVQALGGGGLALGAGGALNKGPGFLRVEGRGEADRHWVGRGTIGVDFFPRSKLDLTLGLFAGSVGRGSEHLGWVFEPTAGCELGLGTQIGPVSGRWLHASAFEGPASERLSEDSLRVAFHFSEAFALFGQVIHFDPGADDGASGVGIGGTVTL